ncbi:MAG: biotin--[acetyl-CoA-carboxylase] ligase [Planctomycetes bacterium]|nr:biotin--[acetyl-CoA-carboxylase] ligase [Planctomycetota bacterium]
MSAGEGSRWFHEVEYLDSVDSTSAELKRRLKERGGDQVRGMILVAHEQTAGRGRQERTWWSGKRGDNLALSACIPATEPAIAGGLVTACALAEVLEAHSQRPVAFKWPNDVLLATESGWAKCAGLLSEVLAGSADSLILGMGVNLRSAPPPSEADYPTTCVGPDLDPTLFFADLLHAWDSQLQGFQEDGPATLEATMLMRLSAWAPRGIQVPSAPHLPSGPLVEFTLSGGLTWGLEGAKANLPLGALPALDPL